MSPHAVTGYVELLVVLVVLVVQVAGSDGADGGPVMTELKFGLIHVSCVGDGVETPMGYGGRVYVGVVWAVEDALL